jgi:hypothetical protein
VAPYVPIAGPHNIKVDQGATLSFGVIRKDYKKRVLPLTGYTARLQVRTTIDSPTVILELTTENGGLTIDGPRVLIDVFATDTQTGAIPVGKYVYDLEVVSPVEDGSIVERMIKGSFTVSGEVTR